MTSVSEINKLLNSNHDELSREQVIRILEFASLRSEFLENTTINKSMDLEALLQLCSYWYPSSSVEDTYRNSIYQHIVDGCNRLDPKYIKAMNKYHGYISWEILNNLHSKTVDHLNWTIFYDRASMNWLIYEINEHFNYSGFHTWKGYVSNEFLPHQTVFSRICNFNPNIGGTAAGIKVYPKPSDTHDIECCFKLCNAVLIKVEKKGPYCRCSQIQIVKKETPDVQDLYYYRDDILSVLSSSHHIDLKQAICDGKLNWLNEYVVESPVRTRTDKKYAPIVRQLLDLSLPDKHTRTVKAALIYTVVQQNLQLSHEKFIETLLYKLEEFSETENIPWAMSVHDKIKNCIDISNWRELDPAPAAQDAMDFYIKQTAKKFGIEEDKVKAIMDGWIQDPDPCLTYQSQAQAAYNRAMEEREFLLPNPEIWSAC